MKKGIASTSRGEADTYLKRNLNLTTPTSILPLIIAMNIAALLTFALALGAVSCVQHGDERHASVPGGYFFAFTNSGFLKLCIQISDNIAYFLWDIEPAKRLQILW